MDLPDGSCFSMQKQPEDGAHSWFGRLQIGWQSMPVFQRHGSNPEQLLTDLMLMWLDDLAKAAELEQQRKK